MNLKRTALVGRHATFTACAHVPCRVIAGRIDPSFAEIERHVFGTDWLVVCYIVTKTPDDMAVPATDWLASSNLEHQVIRRAEAIGYYRHGRLFTTGWRGLVCGVPCRQKPITAAQP
jgi:hypothetical protein